MKLHSYNTEHFILDIKKYQQINLRLLYGKYLKDKRVYFVDVIMIQGWF